MFGPKYVWILLGYIEREWWLVNDTSITCSSQELSEAMDGYLATDYLWNTGLDTKTVYGKVFCYWSNLLMAELLIKKGFVRGQPFAFEICLCFGTPILRP